MRRGTFKLNLISFDFEEALTEILDLFEKEAQHKVVLLQTKYAPSFPSFVTSDKQKIQQVLFTLVSSALDALEYGFIDITVAFDVANDQLSICCISETGEPEILPVPMIVGSSSGELGLSLCKRIVKSLGGELEER